VNDGGSLQRLSRLLIGHPGRRQFPQLIIYQRQQFLGSLAVSISDGPQDLSDVAHGLRSRLYQF
jgi:hypothetical protein